MSSVNDEQSHNKRLHQFLIYANEALNNAKEPQDLIEVVEKARQFNGKFRFKNRNFYLSFLGIFALFLTLLPISIDHDNGFGIFLSITLLMIAGMLFNRMRSRNRRTARLAQRIFYRDLLFDNQLEIAQSVGPYSIEALQQRFTEFDRGNYSRSIESLIQGKFTGEKRSFSYHYLHFHYVNRREITETDSQGRESTRVVYDHYDRYGLLLPFPYITAVKIQHQPKLLGLNKGTYQPASIDFNKQFHVWAKEEFQAARFLTPTTVQTIENIPQHFKKAALEFATDGELLFMFEDDDLISAKRQYDLNDPDAFLQEIAGITELPRLKDALKIIEILIAESDNNFA